MRALRSALPVALLSLFAVTACGDDTSPGAPAAGGAGTSGGGNAGAAGSGGASGPGGLAGAAGVTGKGGAAGASGNATTGGAGGGSGSGGTSGTAGTSSGACQQASDCPAPTGTVPSGCAVATCVSGACGFAAADKDGDGHATNACKANVVIVLGDDCDDGNGEVFPGAWDGPAADGKPNRCGDGVDQDCSGKDGDAVGSKGASCLCIPGDVATCATGADGKAITFPGGSPQGECKLGSRACVLSASGSGGEWGPCVGAIGPSVEVCNANKDDDCDGLADMADTNTPPTNLITYSYDGDGDGYVSKTSPDAKRVRWCSDGVPPLCPSDVPGCDPTRWTSGTLPAGDCDDTSLDAAPGGVEICDEIDNDCNGVIDDPYASDARVWVWDWDDDDFGDIDVKAVRSCGPPKTLPAYCASLQTNVPPDYATGLPAEGTPPTVPVPACETKMWKTGFPNTDCKDNPTQPGARGNKPHLVQPMGKDLCNGLDYSCDGSPTTGCPCTLGDPPVPCGAADACNAGTQTCVLVNGSAVLSACSGGLEKDKVIYCPDDDGDSYCDLQACTNPLCPGAAPADHTYKVRGTCAGESLPNDRGHDCNDDPLTNGAKANPGVVNEKCDGTNVDYNCNGVLNTAGLGDCLCNTGDKVACGAAGLEYPSTPPSDKYPLGAGPALKGVCVWGEKTCVAGSWTSCGGGVGAASQEVCDGTGKDYNCNGIANTAVPPAASDCGCQNGQTAACGVCGTGIKTCSNGAWGGCAGDASKIEYCVDGDGDGVCAGCSLVCPNALPANGRPKNECLLNGVAIDCADADPTRGQNKVELCGGPDENCNGVVNEGYDLGAVCDFGSGVGACKKGGAKVCTGSPSLGTTCGPTAGVGADTCRTEAFVPPGGGTKSWDWDCDGQNEGCVGTTALTIVGRNGQAGPNVLRTGMDNYFSIRIPGTSSAPDYQCSINTGTGSCPDVYAMNGDDCPGGIFYDGSEWSCPTPWGGRIYRVFCAKEVGNPSLKRCYSVNTAYQASGPYAEALTLGSH